MILIQLPELLLKSEKVYNLPDNRLNTAQTCKIVLLYDSAKTILSPQLKEMTDKLVAACKFTAEDAVYIDYSVNSVSLGTIQNKLAPMLILVFGNIDFTRNMQKMKKHFVYDINDTKIIITSDMAALDSNKAEKSALWGVLQKALGLK
jgi:hypothetical protein